MLVHFRVEVGFFQQKLSLLTALNFGNVCSLLKKKKNQTCGFLKLILPIAVASQLNMYSSNSSFKIILTNWRNGLKLIKNKCEVLQLSHTKVLSCPSTHIQTCATNFGLGGQGLQSKLGFKT